MSPCWIKFDANHGTTNEAVYQSAFNEIDWIWVLLRVEINCKEGDLRWFNDGKSSKDKFTIDEVYMNIEHVRETFK